MQKINLQKASSTSLYRYSRQAERSHNDMATAA